ncbi:hypothetical protein BSPWISOXPB_3686 [uncultured Gammaproteobacteria bacterium]|nr:hypothetical protein BSPWISOXPB_3686 [uncultured Gammaproteobacteria bacterium]
MQITTYCTDTFLDCNRLSPKCKSQRYEFPDRFLCNRLSPKCKSQRAWFQLVGALDCNRLSPKCKSQRPAVSVLYRLPNVKRKKCIVTDYRLNANHNSRFRFLLMYCNRLSPKCKSQRVSILLIVTDYA